MSNLTLNDLNMLNQEIAAFVRAGIPLELGLRGLSGGVGSRLGRLSSRLAERMTEGRNLSDALAAEGPAISPVYTAVVEAGLASGKLPEALQSLSESGQIIQETQRRVFLAAMYPVICLGVAYLMFCFFLSAIAPIIVGTVEMFPRNWPLKSLQMLINNQGYFTMVIPATALTICVVMFLMRTVAGGPWKRITAIRWVTGRSLDWAQFTEILALQVEHQAPLPKAFVLAADSTNDRRLHRESRKVSDALIRGESLARAIQSATSLPPLVRWMIATGEKQGVLAATLRQLADMYRRNALRRAAILRVWLPATMTIMFTTLIGLTYGLAFFVPLRAFLIGLMQE